MIEQVQKAGVKTYYGEDMIILQKEPLYALQEMVSQYGNCVLQGCDVTGTTINSGLVGVSGIDPDGNSVYKICRFNGASDVQSFPVYLVLNYSVTAREYGDLQSKPISYNYFASISSGIPSSNYVKINSTGPEKMFVDAIQDSTHRMVTDSQIAQWDSSSGGGEPLEMLGSNKLYKVATLQKGQVQHLYMLLSNTRSNGNEQSTIFQISNKGTSVSSASYTIKSTTASDSNEVYIQVYQTTTEWVIYLRSESFCDKWSLLPMGVSNVIISPIEMSVAPEGSKIHDGKTDSIRVVNASMYGSGKGIDADTVDDKHATGALNTLEQYNLVTAINEINTNKVAYDDLSVTAVANKVPKANASGILEYSITGNSESVGGKTASGTLDTSEKTNLVAAINEVRTAALVQFPIGGIMSWPGLEATIPSNFKKCNGVSLSRTTYASLFSVIGTKYGSIDIDSFNVPQLDGRFITGATQDIYGGTDIYNVGYTGGENYHTLIESEMPEHKHISGVYSASGANQSVYGTALVPTGERKEGGASSNTSPWTSETGGSSSHENRPPFMAFYWIIRVL